MSGQVVLFPKKCGPSEPLPVPETACFQPPDGSCAEKKQDANNNKAEEPKPEPEPTKCRRMPKTDCSRLCSAPPPPKPKDDDDCAKVCPKADENACEYREAKDDPPRPDGGCTKSSIPKTSACACGTGGSCCGPNTACEVRPLKMKKKPLTGKLPMP